MKKSSPTQGNVQLERDAGDSSTQESDYVNTKSRQKRRAARDEKDEFLVLKNEIREWLRSFQRDQNARLDKLQEQQNSRLDAMKGRIAELSAKLTTANNTSQDIGKSVDFVSEKIFELQEKIVSFKKTADWTALSSQISDLEDKHETLARAMNKTCIEIRNVPKQSPTPTKSELFDLILKLCSGLSIELHSGDIRDVSRFTNRKDNMSWNLTVELSNTLLKNNILSATRKYNIENRSNKLNASHLGLGAKIESQEEIEAMFPTQAVQGTKELDQLTSKLLEYELRHIMIKVWQVFPDDPVTDDVKFVTEKFRNEAGDDLRNVIGLNVTKRLLNVHNKLIVKVRFSCRPEKENLLAFLKKYRVTGFKRIKSATNTFAAQLKNIDDFDKICSTKEIRCGKSKITITPCYNFMKRPPHLKTKFVDDTDDEKAEESHEIQQKPMEAPEIKLKMEVKKAPEEKINIETTPLQNKEIKGHSGHKLETMKKSTNENTVIDSTSTKTDFNNKPSINTPTSVESVPKSAEKVVASGTKVTKPTATKNNTAFKKPVSMDEMRLVSEKQNIESVKKLHPKTAENVSKSIQKSPKVTKIESKETVKKIVGAKSRAKIVCPVKKTNFKSPVAMQKINKNDIINKYNDYDEMNDEDIVALLADSVVLDEYASDDE